MFGSVHVIIYIVWRIKVLYYTKLQTHPVCCRKWLTDKERGREGLRWQEEEEDEEDEEEEEEERIIW